MIEIMEDSTMKKRGIAAIIIMAMFMLVFANAYAGETYSDTLVTDDDADDTNGLAFEPVTEITKQLEIESGANVPACSFTYTASVPEGLGQDSAFVVAADVEEGTLAVLKGLNPDKIKWHVGDDEAVQGNSGVIEYEPLDNPEKSIFLDFSECGFDEPGVYRYLITETGENIAVTNDAEPVRTLDVYVDDADTEDGDGAPMLRVSGFVLYKGEIDEGPSSEGGDAIDGAEKTTGYINSYSTNNLVFAKEVTGNQGSRDKYFAFTLTIDGAAAGTVMQVSYADDNDANTVDGNADIAISANPNSATTVITADVEQPETLVADQDGSVSQVFYLQHGQSIAVRGIPEGASYSLEENAEDYTPAFAVEGDTTDEGEDLEDDADDTDIASGDADSVSDSALTDDTTVTFTNTRAGVLPTGITMPLVLPVGALVVIVAAIAVLAVKRKNYGE